MLLGEFLRRTFINYFGNYELGKVFDECMDSRIL